MKNVCMKAKSTNKPESELKLSEILKTELQQRNMSAHEICKKLAIPASVFNGWLHNAQPSAKNLHQVKKLADFFDLPLSVLLFNASSEDNSAEVLFSSVFKDKNAKYRLTIEKISDNKN